MGKTRPADRRRNADRDRRRDDDQVMEPLSDGWPWNEPDPPEPEFDRDVQWALASPGLAKDEREDIRSRARALRESGTSREDVTNWICREVARVVGGRSGFEAYDEDGNQIDLPHVAEAREQITREIKAQAGAQRQRKRNADIKKWEDRCRELIAKGKSAEFVFDVCYDAIVATTRGALGDKNPFRDCRVPLRFLELFDGLPPILGRDKKSPPGQRRLRERLLRSLK
jgi:hypothetical protein